ncbi:hypothetical protein F5Y16DRAFT_267504 [Xylariaceae sp. FL0255]|nr:hypothetical protein F5Y16DRAFT_267504 [Xylariaceae sp. FL0255]
MASTIQPMSVLGSHGTRDKYSKNRSNKSVVKPILKKFAQSDREKKSLDLDRGWDDQDEQWGNSDGGYDQTMMMAGADSTVVLSRGGAEPSSNRVRRFNHSRSISATSHASVATSTSSNNGATPRATFVHPFQQTPRTSTPPLLSYANSLASIADAPDSILIDEGDGDDMNERHTHSTTTASNNSLYIQYHHPHSRQLAHHGANLPTSQSASNLRRPSLPGHTTTTSTINSVNTSSSLTEVPNASSSTKFPSHSHSQPPVGPPRLTTSRTFPAQSSRLVNVSSRSDLHLDQVLDSPASSHPPSITAATPASSIAPMSPLRVSLDSGFPRIRAKSDVDTQTRAEHLRAARQKFEMKEKAKDEKYAREEAKRRERTEKKLAQEMEKQLAARCKEQLAAQQQEELAAIEEAMLRGKHNRKVSIASSGRHSFNLGRPSLSTGRPSTSRKNTAASQFRTEPEKFAGSYKNTAEYLRQPSYGEQSQNAGDVQFEALRRKNTAKRKTHSAWTAFMLWLRTKLFRMGKN